LRARWAFESYAESKPVEIYNTRWASNPSAIEDKKMPKTDKPTFVVCLNPNRLRTENTDKAVASKGDQTKLEPHVALAIAWGLKGR
jgi:hypothetical protein